jgi:hypothetical protein
MFPTTVTGVRDPQSWLKAVSNSAMPCGERFNHRTCVIGRAVVDDYDLIAGLFERLPENRLQSAGKQLRMIVGANYNGKSHLVGGIVAARCHICRHTEGEW